MTINIDKNFIKNTLVVILVLIAVVWLVSGTNWFKKITANIGAFLTEISEQKPEPQEPKTDGQKPESQLSNLKVRALGYYYGPQGDQLGIGPLPPKVDAPTSIWVFYEVQNQGHQLTNFKLSATLADRVVYPGNQTVLNGYLQYAEVSRRLVWTIDNIKENNEIYKVGFELTIIPKTQDTGQILDFLKDIQFSAYDTSVQKEISGILKNITTNLDDDNLASQKGRVVPLQ
jgi:hypothetical protein